MAVSVFDLFSIGIGPSSSHTVGPMRAARMFVKRLDNEDLLPKTARVRTELFGSLGATGHGHGTPKAVLLGLEGQIPATVDVRAAESDLARIRETNRLRLLSTEQGTTAEIAFTEDRDLVLHRRKALPYHSNGMQLTAYDGHGEPLLTKTYYSVGGGFVVDEDAVGADRVVLDDTVLKYPFRTGAELLDLTAQTGFSVSGLMLENELAWRTEPEVRAGLLEIWRVMRECVTAGISTEGILPGGLKVRRRAPGIARTLRAEGNRDVHANEWATLWAMAVNEENAAGGRRKQQAIAHTPANFTFESIAKACDLPYVQKVSATVVQYRCSIGGYYHWTWTPTIARTLAAQIAGKDLTSARDILAAYPGADISRGQGISIQLASGNTLPSDPSQIRFKIYEGVSHLHALPDVGQDQAG